MNVILTFKQWVIALATRAVLETRLREAENAYHELNVTGAVRTLVDQNGERIEYTVTNTQRLQAYITSLKVELGLDHGMKGPLEVFF